MSRRIVRLIVAVGLALSMMLVGAGGALAFDPPDHEDASNICGFQFPAVGIGVGKDGEPGGFGPWNATPAGGNNPGPLEFDAEGGNCDTA